MKKMLSLFLIVCILALMTSCGDNIEDKAKDAISSASTVEELDAALEKDVDETISALETEFKELEKELNTYEKYKENKQKVQDFCDKVINDTDLLCIRLREYSSAYADLVLDSDKSTKDKREYLDVIRKSVYDKACDKIRNKIYDSLMDDLRNAFYDGVIKDARDSIEYDEYSDERSKAYDLRDSTRSEIYDIRDAARSDIYNFRDELRSKLYDGDEDGAKKKIENFNSSIDRMYENKKK